jgi:hypothetical protein
VQYVGIVPQLVTSQVHVVGLGVGSGVGSGAGAGVLPPPLALTFPSLLTSGPEPSRPKRAFLSSGVKSESPLCPTVNVLEGSELIDLI